MNIFNRGFIFKFGKGLELRGEDFNEGGFLIVEKVDNSNKEDGVKKPYLVTIGSNSYWLSEEEVSTLCKKTFDNFESFLVNKKASSNILKGIYGEFKVIRVSSGIEDIDYIYSCRGSDTENVFFDPMEEIELFGIYHKTNNQFYPSESTIFEEVNIVNTIKMTTLDNLREDILEQVREAIKENIKTNESFDKEFIYDDKEDLEYKITHLIPKLAYNLVIQNKEANLYSYLNDFRLGDTKYIGNILIEFIINREAKIKELRDEFIQKYSESISKDIYTSKLIQSEVRKIESNDSIIRRRKLAEIFFNDKIKTINVLLKSGTEEVVIKVDNSSYYLEYLRDSISSTSVVSSDRNYYESKFQDNNILLDDILEIRYGNKVLYKK